MRTPTGLVRVIEVPLEVDVVPGKKVSQVIPCDGWRDLLRASTARGKNHLRSVDTKLTVEAATAAGS
jgi:hypothetical protein